MIKVRIVPRGPARFARETPVASSGGTRFARAGLVALTSGLAATQMACTADAVEAHEDVDSDESAYTVSDPGSGVFELGWAYGTPSGYSFNLTKSTTDEYVRARESMSFSIPAHFLWSRLYPNDAMPEDLARLKQLSAKIKVVYVKGGAVYANTSVATGAWTGDQTWSLSTQSASFIVSRRAQGLRFEMTIKDAANAQASVTLGQDQFLEVPVLGANVPNKTALFDNMYSSLRHRILEGGQPVRGAELAIAYTDWRANTLVDSGSIDRQIGTQTSFSRFGPIQVPIHGEIEYEISYGVAFDGQWQDERALSANGKSRLMPPYGRTAWEATVDVPTTTKGLQIYFHVKAFLKVDYSRYSNITWRKYADGERILVREKWDNENNAPGDNWDLATEKR